VHFFAEAFKHHKPVAASDDGLEVLREAGIADQVRAPAEGGGPVADRGVVLAANTGGALPDGFLEEFAAALGEHRAWDRDTASTSA
jgi:catalase